MQEIAKKNGTEKKRTEKWNYCRSKAGKKIPYFVWMLLTANVWNALAELSFYSRYFEYWANMFVQFEMEIGIEIETETVGEVDFRIV